MKHYYTETPYYCHDMCMGETSLTGPFDTPEERAADIEQKRQDDHWNLQEDGITLLLIDSETEITAGEQLTLTDPVFEETPEYVIESWSDGPDEDQYGWKAGDVRVSREQLGKCKNKKQVLELAPGFKNVLSDFLGDYDSPEDIEGVFGEAFADWLADYY